MQCFAYLTKENLNWKLCIWVFIWSNGLICILSKDHEFMFLGYFLWCAMPNTGECFWANATHCTGWWDDKERGQKAAAPLSWHNFYNSHFLQIKWEIKYERSLQELYRFSEPFKSSFVFLRCLSDHQNPWIWKDGVPGHPTLTFLCPGSSFSKVQLYLI